MLAPTTVLAAQHFRTVNARFAALGFRVALLTRYTPA
jgi:transcription-repair coupling factor (superfamily II helicase)